jgi:hypothetical protein
MGFDETWSAVVKANPKLKGARVDMTPANFKKIMKYVFEMGEEENSGGDLFGSLFGSRGR